MNKLVISFQDRLLHADSEVIWVLYGDSDRVLFGPEQASLSVVKEKLEEKGSEALFRLFVIAPGDEISLSSVNMPSKQKKHIQKALPFMIEDQLASDLESCFFAIGEHENDHLKVLTLDQSLMENWYSSFHNFGLYPEAMYTDYMLIKDAIDGDVLVFHENKAILISKDGKAFHFEKDLLPIYLKTFRESDPGDDDDNVDQAGTEENAIAANETDKVKVIFFDSSENDDNLKNNEATLNQIKDALKFDDGEKSSPLLDVSYKTESFFDFLTQISISQGRGSSIINLLQANFRAKRPPTKFKLDVNWKPLATAMFCLFITYILILNFERKDYLEKARSVDQQTKQIFTEIFPGTRNFAKMKNRVQSLLDSAPSGEVGGFMQSLYLATEVLANINAGDPGSLSAKQIAYERSNNELRFDLIATSIDILDKFKTECESSGFEVEIVSAKAEGESTKGRLKMRLLE